MGKRDWHCLDENDPSPLHALAIGKLDKSKSNQPSEKEQPAAPRSSCCQGQPKEMALQHPLPGPDAGEQKHLPAEP